MKGQKYIAGFMTVTLTTISLLTSNVKASYAASPVQLPETFAISPAENNNMVVDKFGDSINTAANAHLYDKSNPATHTLTGDRAANGSYEVHLNSNRNLCLTMAGGLNPNQGNGTLAVFSSNCANSLNLMFMNDNTIRVSRNQNLCLTNQGNRSGKLFNRLHFWACDDSRETKFSWYGVNGNVGVGNLSNTSTNSNVKTVSSSNTIPNELQGKLNQAINGKPTPIKKTKALFVIDDILSDIVKQALYGDEIKFVSLDEDGESWEAAAKRCARDAGYLNWFHHKNRPVAEKTCYKNGR
jgi:hypothetical protein